MADIVITYTTSVLKIVFNNTSHEIALVKGCFNRNHISEVVELQGGGVIIVMLGEHGPAKNYKVSYDGNNGGRVQSVGGTAITSDSQLCDLIGGLMK